MCFLFITTNLAKPSSSITMFLYTNKIMVCVKVAEEELECPAQTPDFIFTDYL